MKIFLTLILILCIPALSFAQGSVGQAETEILAGILSGNLGLVIGLVAAIFGLYIWLIEQRSWGIIMIILGATFTAFPAMFEAIYNGVNPLIQTTGGQRDGFSVY